MNTSTTTPTHKNRKPSERKVPPLIIQKNRLTTENEELSSPSPNSDNEFRSPIKTAKNKNKTAENIFFTTPNRYEPLINSQTEEILTSANNSQQHMETEKTQNNTNQKIPPVFVINNSDYIKLREEISPLLHNNFTATNKNKKIKINVETVDDFRTITKFFEEKKYEYFTYRLKSEKDISAVIRNLPILPKRAPPKDNYRIRREYTTKRPNNHTEHFHVNNKQHDSKPNQTFNNLKMNIINIKDIILVNWNANGLKSKRSTLAEFLSRNKIDIAGITETHLKDSENFKIPGYEIYRNDRKHTHSSGGVAILIKKNLKHNPIILPPTIQMEAVAINLVTDKHDLRVISSYNPPNKKIQNSDLPKLFNNTPTILLGDLNSKNTIWGCKKTNPNGHKLYEYTSDLNILVSPPPGPTFYRTGVTPDILDIMLISNFPTNLYHKVLNELDSDHVPVLTSLKIQAEANPPIQKLINRPIKWEIFKENIDKILKPYRKYTNTNDINSGIIHLTESIKSAIDLALAPPKNKKPHMNSTPIPSHIQNLIKEKHKARRN
ncbi:hypothetical protein QTP88_027966 [Uroleucon formosanum]